MKKIFFGTDGWRGILAEDFNFSNVRLVARSIGMYILDHGLAARGVVVGYDNRFFSDRFAAEIAGVLSGQGIPVRITDGAAPTPVVAYAVKLYHAGGGIMLTASHNPPEYNGIKFIPEYAGPALPHITGEIEDNIRKTMDAAGRETDNGGSKKAAVIKVNPYPDYARHMNTLVDINAIGEAGLKVVVDPMHGAGARYLENMLMHAGALVTAIRDYSDPLFGGGLPEPTAGSLGLLREKVINRGAHLGLALDGDADRFGIIDRSGEFITPNQFLPVLLYHLYNVRGMRGPVARTVATTHQLDRIAGRAGQQVFETPVGFKYIAQCLTEKGAVLGGEESGGLSVQGHVPEKDGILAGLLAAEIVAVHGKSLNELMEQVAVEYGSLYSERLDVHTSLPEKERVLRLLKELKPSSLGKRRVAGRNAVDGVKFLLEGGAWVLVRPSGTEPLFRIYVEASTPEELKEIQKDTKTLLGL
ncbi:phosphoglucomutase/phosphomannomutase family protein [Pelotomaculum propionicicum]|uniref:phosphoglucomutase/phosphomannomutase family protein n=1 Tax=Pelotomaculum propionicicum TaxID=258475 RepID=UPI003B77F1F6